MTNEYYVKPADLAPGTKARSVDINALMASVDLAFGKVPNAMSMKTGTLNYAVDTGTTPNAYVVALDAAITSYTDGLVVRMRPTRANTGAASLNVNGMGAVAIKRIDGLDMQAGDIGVNLPVELVYAQALNAFVSGVVLKSQVDQVATQSAAAVASAAAAATSASTASSAASLAVARSNMAATVGLRNVLINGCMRVHQRGVDIVIPAGGTAYTLDRWLVYNGLNVAVTIQQATVNNYANSDGVSRMRVSANAIPTSGAVYVNQRVEGVHVLAGLDVTMAATILSAETTMQCRFLGKQGFGIGGSADVVFSGAYFNPSNTTQRSPAQKFTLPPTVGKTVGAGNFVEYTIELSLRTTNGMTLTEVQVEPGVVSTPFERRPVGFELSLCQRYYQQGNLVYRGYANSGTDHGGSVMYPVAMRVAPTVTLSTSAATNFPAVNSTLRGTGTPYQFDYSRTANATGPGLFADTWYAYAEL